MRLPMALSQFEWVRPTVACGGGYNFGQDVSVAVDEPLTTDTDAVGRWDRARFITLCAWRGRHLRSSSVQQRVAGTNGATYGVGSCGGG